jgi:Aerotolerance regulator N-terminal
MIFQYPSFLWALLALAIPIIVHLFNFRKTIRVYFSNTKFLRQINQETTQKRKLKQYLVLASRLLFIFFLVMSFAQPFLKATNNLASSNLVSIYLDNSFSLSAPIDDKTRALDEAISRVQQLMEAFPADTRYQLITNDFAPFSNSPKSKTEVQDFLTQVRFSAVSRSATEILKRHEKRSTLFWFSDFQVSTLGAIPKIDSMQKIQFVPIDYGKPNNVFVDSIRLENPFMIGGEKNSIHVRLRNSGEKLVESLVVKLSINGKQVSASTINIEPQSNAEAVFDLSGGQSGRNRGTISFSDYPVSFDNEFYFTLNYTGKLNVIEVKQLPEPTYISKVFANQQLFNFSSYEIKNVNYSLFQQADLVVVNGINEINPSFSSALASHRNRQSLLFIPGTKPNVESYQRALNLPIQFAPEAKELISLERPDWANPLFQNIVEEKSAALAMPGVKKNIEWGADRTALLKLKDGRPYLSQFQNLFILGSPMEKGYTDFYQHALFVPFMYRLAASGKKQDEQLYFSLSSSQLVFKADSILGEEPIRLVGNQEIIPSQRKVNNQISMELPKFSLSPGFFAVLHQIDTLGWLAINTNKAESILTTLPASEVKKQWGGSASIGVIDSSSPTAFGDQLKARYLGKPLWKYTLLLALLFLLAEVLLLRFLK